MEPVTFNYYSDLAFNHPEKGYSFGFKFTNVHELLMDHKNNQPQPPPLITPSQRSFVWIYFKKSTRYHVSSGEAASSPHRPLRRPNRWSQPSSNTRDLLFKLDSKNVGVSRSFLMFQVSLRGYSRSNLPALPNQPFPGSRILIRNVINFLKHCLIPPTRKDCSAYFFLQMPPPISKRFLIWH